MVSFFQLYTRVEEVAESRVGFTNCGVEQDGGTGSGGGDVASTTGEEGPGRRGGSVHPCRLRLLAP